MKPPTTPKMTPEAQRIAIAEACGFTKVFVERRYRGFFKAIEQMVGEVATEKGVKPVPDYLSDLNACHAMEKVLTDGQWQRYTSIVNSDFTQGSATIMKAICHATATQRCEAFLKTLSLWQETPTKESLYNNLQPHDGPTDFNED